MTNSMKLGMWFLHESCLAAKTECFFHRNVYLFYHVCLVNEIGVDNPYTLH